MTWFLLHVLRDGFVGKNGSINEELRSVRRGERADGQSEVGRALGLLLDGGKIGGARENECGG